MSVRFKHTEATRNLFNKVIGDYQDIDSDKHLRNRHLSLSDYRALGFLLDSLRFYGEAKTIIESIANYFGRLGCKVAYKGIAYTITL